MINKIVKESYDEIIHDINEEMEIQTNLQHPSPQQRDMSLGDAAARLAQLKGELNTLLDKATRSGIIVSKNGKISILKKEEYIKHIGDLPKRIRELQIILEPSDETNS